MQPDREPPRRGRESHPATRRVRELKVPKAQKGRRRRVEARGRWWRREGEASRLHADFILLNHAGLSVTLSQGVNSAGQQPQTTVLCRQLTPLVHSSNRQASREVTGDKFLLIS